MIGEDTFLMREALERIVSGFDYIDVVAFCGDRGSLTAAIERERPDAVVTDIRMPPTGTDEGIQ
ncbi:MAG: DNA-binding response regulator, partial [Solirubrobacteraceae bacterium]